MDCHDPHSQDKLFEVPDDMCINCHQEDMEKYLEDLHIQKDIGCVDCHALVIPPEVEPEDGIVPTGHAFTITPSTCVACHTDALHAGFSLPGFENGAAQRTETITDTLTITDSTLLVAEQAESESRLSPEQRIQALETSLANRQLATLFQGGLIGLALGGTTAWLVARNLRRIEDQPEEAVEEQEPASDDENSSGTV
jgi:formate-dependent nitrite reductase cytochrome c552 subunit